MTITNGKHDFKAQSIYGDSVAFNRVKRLMAEALERRMTQQRMQGEPTTNRRSDIITNDGPFTARANWLEGGGEDDLDPRRSIWDECGYPSTRFMSPQRWQTLNDRDAVANTVNEAMTRYCWQVTPEVFESEQGKVVTAWDKAWRDLASQLRYGGMPDWFGEVGGGPIEDTWERADGLSGIGRFGVIVYGLDDNEGWAKPVPGIQEDGSQPGEQMVNETTGQPVFNTLMTAPDANGKRKAIGQTPVLRINKGNEQRYVLNFATPDNPQLMAKTQGRKLAYINTFSEAMVRPNRFETNKFSPRFGRPTSYQVTFTDPKNPIWGVGLPLSTEMVHWTRIQHIAKTVGTYSNGAVFAIPECQVCLNNIMALSKVYHGAPEGFWKFALPYLFLSTHPQLGGDVDVDDEGLKDMIEAMMNGLQKAGILTGMDAKMVGGSFADPTPIINVHQAAIAAKKRMPVRILTGALVGGLGSTGPADNEGIAWDKQVRKQQNGWCTSAVIRASVNQLTWYGVLPQPEKPGALKRYWPDIADQTPDQLAETAAKRMGTISQWRAGAFDAMTLFDLYVKELGYSEDEAYHIIKNVAAATGQDIASMGAQGDPEVIDAPEEEAAAEDWQPPDAGSVTSETADASGKPLEQESGQPSAVPTGNVRMCWGRPCGEHSPESIEQGASNAVKEMQAVEAKHGNPDSESPKHAKMVDELHEVAKRHSSELDALAADHPKAGTTKMKKAIYAARDRIGAFVRVYNQGLVIDNERMCWGKPCPDDFASAPKNVAATKAKMLSAHATKTGADEHHLAAAQAHDEAAKAHFEHYSKSGDPGSLHRIKEHAEAAAAHRAHLDAATTKHAPTPDPYKTVKTPAPKAQTTEETIRVKR